MEWWNKIKQQTTLRRTLALVLIGILLYIFRSIINLLLITFILTYLLTRLINVLYQKTKIPKKVIIILTYLLIVLGLYFSITVYVPKLFNQTISMIESVFAFYQHPENQVGAKGLWHWLSENVGLTDIKNQITSGVRVVFDTISSIGSIGLTFLLAFVLSFFFLIEEEWVKDFSKGFKNSKIALFSEDVSYLGRKFINTFGVVLEAQFIIALVNTVLTTIALSLMKFPQLLSLALMIFILSLIPVAGVIISCIPLSLIAYSIGGIQDVIYVLILIAVIHAIESYFLNPKLMSSKTNLPVFYVFIVLMFSEKFFGVWGLVLGIPTFVFILDLLEVKMPEAKILKVKEK